MIVGIDFDNTIVCYDGLFHQAAVARELIPAATPSAKEAVRNVLRAANREDAWTELQGRVYGHEIHRALPFDGVFAFLQRCEATEVTVNVVSHRTRQPYAGPAIDMHQAARQWLADQNWFTDTAAGLGRERVFFEETKADKLARIAATGCDVFIDDLPEFLAEPGFPRGVQQILFDPHGARADDARFKRVCSWPDLTQFLMARGDS